jgi:restriction system protein
VFATTEREGNPPELLLGSQIVLLGDRVPEGAIVEAVSIPWLRLRRELQHDPGLLIRADWRTLEELVAAAYHEVGYEVVLTPRSGDGGRDVIATRHGDLSVRILDQVKKYAAGHLVSANDVRALLGVLSADQKASKAVITTTSDFAPGVRTDSGIACFLPTRLELRNGNDLARWLEETASRRERR